MLTVPSLRGPQHALTFALFAVALGSAAASAQDAATRALLITVRDSTGAGIAGAELRVEGSDTRGYTDEGGRFRLIRPTATPDAPTRVWVRRLGFRPATLDVPGGAPAATITLVRALQELPAIVVRGRPRHYTGRMAGFYERRDLGIGRFITRAEIERLHPLRTTDLFRRIPGVTIASTRVIPQAIRFRGATSCHPLVWLDGTPAAAAEFDLDALIPESIEGIEIYSGISEVPVQFRLWNADACGVVVVWSREGERRPKKSKKPVSPAELARLVASLEVYTADEVDTPAHPDTNTSLEPIYPDSLLLARVEGSVTAEFVVDTTGEVLMDTFGVISSTSPAFTAAVRRAIADASFVPATRDGHPVKQVVHQPFTFSVDSARTPRARPE